MNARKATLKLVYVLVFLLITAVPLASAQPIELIFQQIFSLTAPNSIVMKNWIDRVEKESNGRLKFKVFPNNQLVPSDQSLDALSKGSLDMLYTSALYFSNKTSIADFLMMPYNFPKGDQQLMDVWYKTNVGKIVDRVYRAKANAVVLGPRLFGPGEVFLQRPGKEIRKADDFKGMMMRAGGGVLNDAVKMLGAVPVTVVAGDVYTGLQRGTFDGALFPLYSLDSYKLFEIRGSVSIPPFLPACAILLWMNQDKWNSLPSDLQKIIIKTLDDDKDITIKWWADYYVGFEKKARDMGTKFITIPDSEYAIIRQRVMPVWDVYARSEGNDSKQIFEILKSQW